MSSQRVVSFELSPQQRAQVRQVVGANLAIADRRIARARDRMLVELDRLAGQAPTVTLPSAAEIEAAFRAMVDVEAPSRQVEEYEERLLAASTEKAAQARTGLTTGLDRATSQRLDGLLARLPSDHVPAPVAAAAEKVSTTEGPARASALENVRRLVKAEVEGSRRRAQIRVELDHADTILRVLVAEGNGLSARLRGTAEQLAERAAVAEAEYRDGGEVASGVLVTAAVALQQEFERDQHDAHALQLLRQIWEKLGYQLAADDEVPGFLARKPGEGRGMWVGPAGNSTSMTQVNLKEEVDLGRSAADVHASLCSAAGEVEALAVADGMAVHVKEVKEAQELAATIVVTGDKATWRDTAHHMRKGGKR
ncbi:hypothetical protein ACFPJ1_09255 [Kribbella qitaiheensis]|uniref:hypothetical protein n=1 Tax=Kribbella qitaiheensis TaxID=1544730 RepID=UPI003618EFF9